MDALDKLFLETLKWEWVWTYAPLVFIIMAALALVLIITFIIVIACHIHNKHKFADMQSKIDKLSATEPLRDSGELRAEIRAEMEPIIREQIDREYKEKYGKAASQKPNGNGAQADDGKTAETLELYRTLITDLNKTTQELKSEIETLKAENKSLQSAEADEQPEEETTEEYEQPEEEAEEAQTVEDDDDEDEYDNEFGDETSDVKVTVKYDRQKLNWVILRSDTTRTYRRCPTKQEALVIAKDLARRLHAQLVVHKKDGKFQKI